MVIISLFGISIAIICWFYNLYKIKKTEEVEYWIVSLLSFIDSMIHFISFEIFTLGDDKINIIVSIIISLIGYILLIDVIFFAKKRLE